MAVLEKIQERVSQLPEPMQAEVLNFVDFLLSKVDTEKQQPSLVRENAEWSYFSLSMALRGMEDEETDYTLDDLKETF